MGRVISDLPDFTETVADGDLLVCHNVSNPSNKDEKLTVSKLRTDAILARSNTFTVGNQQITSDGASNQALRLKAAANPTVPVLDVRNSSDAVRHELLVEYATNIPAARTMNGYQEFAIQPGNIAGTSPGPAQTLTIDILGNVYANQSVNMTMMMACMAANDGSARALVTEHVAWRTGANNGANGVINVIARALESIGGSVTVTGPTAIVRGVRYTIANGNAQTLNRNHITLLVNSLHTVTVTANVA